MIYMTALHFILETYLHDPDFEKIFCQLCMLIIPSNKKHFTISQIMSQQLFLVLHVVAFYVYNTLQKWHLSKKISRI